MSYEEYVNGEAMELTEDSAAEETVAAETEAVELVEEVEAVDAEIVAEDALVAEAAEEDDFIIQYFVEEPLTTPTVDEELFDATADEEFDFAVDTGAVKSCDPFQAKCDELRGACKDMVQRISKDLKETNYNPYIRSTTTYKYEILKKSTDTEPIDVFEFQRTSGYSLRAMAITTALVAAADVAVGKFLKKKLKK